MASKTHRILAINPGFQSTAIAVFDNERPIFDRDIPHSVDRSTSELKLVDQTVVRKQDILAALDEEGLNLSNLEAVVGRGGLLQPLVGGTYRVNQEMLKDLREGRSGIHPSNLGGILAYEIANQLNLPSYIVDPVVVDEFDSVARVSGFPLVERRSVFHALSQKAAAKRIAKQMRRPYNALNLIVAHMGRGITVGLHKKGQVVDVNNGLYGEGPFSLNRAGSLPAGDLVQICFSGNYSQNELMDLLISKGGLQGYLGASELDEIEAMIRNGDERARLIYHAMAYQIAKEIGGLSTIVQGQIDGIILTGRLAYGDYLVQAITKNSAWIGDVFVVPGEDELKALAEGTLRVLTGEEAPLTYPNRPLSFDPMKQDFKKKSPPIGNL